MFQVKLINGDNTWFTPDVSQQYTKGNVLGGGCRSNTLNNLSYIISDVNITGSIGVELYMKIDNTTDRPHPQFYHDNTHTDGHGFYNIEFIEYN